MSWKEKLKRFKLFHWLYNVLHYKQLRHNRIAYQKFGIHKPLFASISSKDFPDKKSQAWLDIQNSRSIVSSQPGFQNFRPEVQKKLKIGQTKDISS